MEESNEIYSDLMNQYIKETGKPIQNGYDGTIMPDYVFWLEAKANISDEAIKEFQKIIRNQCDEITALKEKAEAYDMLMSGWKKTLKEFANLLGRVVVVNANGDIESFAGEPRIDLYYGVWYLNGDDEYYEDYRYFIPPDLIDFNGDWKDSLTFPDGWEDV